MCCRWLSVMSFAENTTSLRFFSSIFHLNPLFVTLRIYTCTCRSCKNKTRMHSVKICDSLETSAYISSFLLLLSRHSLQETIFTLIVYGVLSCKRDPHRLFVFDVYKLACVCVVASTTCSIKKTG